MYSSGNQVEEPQYDTFQAFSTQLLSQNWKDRKYALDIIHSNLDNQELISVFWQLVNTLMRETNIYCLNQTLIILYLKIGEIPHNRLEEIVYILINNNLQNQKTTIHKIAEDILLVLSYYYPKLVLDTLTISLDSKIQRQIKTSLYLLYLLIMQQQELKYINYQDFCLSLINILYTKDLIVRKSAIEVADLLISTSSDRKELFQCFEANLPKSTFYNIINYLVIEHVSDDELMGLLQEKIVKSTSPIKKPVSPDRYGRSAVGYSVVNNNNFVMDDIYVPSYPEIQQIQGMNWKDRKQIIEQLLNEFEGLQKINQQLSGEFCRYLRLSMEYENNVVCENLMIKLVGEICLKVNQFKYLKTMYSAVFGKLKDKKCIQQTNYTLVYLLYVVRFQDTLDSDIQPALATKQTDFKVEVLNYIKNIYQLNVYHDNSYITTNYIVKDTNNYEKMLRMLAICCNDSNNILRYSAADALVNFVIVHLPAGYYCQILYVNILYSCFGSDYQVPFSINQLVGLILSYNPNASVKTNEYRRTGQIIIQMQQMLNKLNINYQTANIEELYNYSAEVCYIFKQIYGQLIQKTPVRKSSAEGFPSPSRPPVQTYQSSAQQLQTDFKRMNYKKTQQAAHIPAPDTSYTDITQIPIIQNNAISLEPLFMKYTQRLQQYDVSVLPTVKNELLNVIGANIEGQLTLYIDAVFDFCIYHLAYCGQPVLIECLDVLNNVIKMYHAHVHPYSIMKFLEILLFRLQEPEVQQYIDELFFNITRLYGLYPILFFVYKYVNEEFIAGDLLSILVRQISQFHLQGLNYQYNILYHAQTVNCNLTQTIVIASASSNNINMGIMLNLMNLIVSCLGSDEYIHTFLSQLQVTDNTAINSLVAYIEKIKMQNPVICLNPILIPNNTVIARYKQHESYIPVLSSSTYLDAKYTKVPVIESTLSSRSDCSKIICSPSNIGWKDTDTTKHIDQSTIYFQPAHVKNIESPGVSQVYISYYQLDEFFITKFKENSAKFVLNEAGVKNLLSNFLDSEFQRYIQYYVYQLQSCYKQYLTQELISHAFMNGFLSYESDLKQVKQLILLLYYTGTQHLMTLLYVNLCQSVIYNDQAQHEVLIYIFHALNSHESNALLFLYILYATYQSLNCSQLFSLYQANFSSVVAAANELFSVSYQNMLNYNIQLMQLLDYLSIQLQVVRGASDAQVSNVQYLVSSLLNLSKSALYENQVILVIQQLTEILQSNECIKHLSLDTQQFLMAQPVDYYMQLFVVQLGGTDDTEQFITILKQMILLIRDNRNCSYNSIVVQIQNHVVARLKRCVNQNEPQNSRLLKYSALLLIELFSDYQSFKYFNCNNVQQIVCLCAYYLLTYIPNLQLSNDAQTKLFKEAAENFQIILNKINQNMNLYDRFVIYSGGLHSVCQKMIGIQQGQDLFDGVQFLNYYQTQVLIRTLLLMQKSVSKEYHGIQVSITVKYLVTNHLYPYFNYIIGWMLSSLKITASITPNDILQLISSQTYSNYQLFDQYLANLSGQHQVEYKEIKLFLRFVRTFVEYFIVIMLDMQFTESQQTNYFMLLVQGIKEAKQISGSQTMGGSLAYNSAIVKSPLVPKNVISVEDLKKRQAQTLQSGKVDQKAVLVMRTHMNQIRHSPLYYLQQIYNYLKDKPGYIYYAHNALESLKCDAYYIYLIISGLSKLEYLDNELKSMFK